MYDDAYDFLDSELKSKKGILDFNEMKKSRTNSVKGLLEMIL